ncbi:Similar to GARNL3: GTPase-activating Rap/Ran-GAP domain-like protein 3 (Gallus gallus) [Cotesia congregata]|uniref:Similar to GARNL3: GTPase-activating Rap/Ran-GAP domain-like protein 3 (Gallus gallus) n=1 Tax=Cotesia congregata TaxID=51543 RepID=A0A8J2HKP1_COTCN|nr:Similar to GARNL3: GTPase-activating Rap/Ran-GAP domain-like protein 3 (Gallus gallus) [Cotesia congregata]
MLSLDMKLVTRLRGLSLTSNSSGSNNTSSTPPSPAPTILSSQVQVGSTTSSSVSSLNERRRSRESGNNVSPCTSDRESDEEITSPRIVRDRSRSVCMPVLTSSQLRHLHRRASHHVSSTDTTSRRGVLSRRCYGSVEMLPQIEQDGIENGRRFRVENGDSPGEKEEMFGSPSTPVLENPENQTRWYFKYFLGKHHERNPLFLSVVQNDGGDQCVPQYIRVILWRRTGTQKIALPCSSNKSMTAKQILSNFFGIEKFDKAPREIFAPEIQKDLLSLEEQEGSVNFKFGVIYAREGQTTDDEMLSNEKASPGFERFLEILGERIRLKGWDKYRGGLDVKGDMTGKESIYTVYAGHEVMFHVSTILPHSKDNPQQLERKRHIGNDIVNIIYTDDPTLLETFNPNCIKSQFTHVFAVVASVERGWQIAIYCDENVPLFGPSLPCPPLFEEQYAFREFLLVKLINGEKATFDTPTFSRKRERTLDSLLRDLYQEHTQESKGNSMLNRRALSDVVETAGRRREETRSVEMVRIGQDLKLDAIVRGLAPTSLATVGPLKPRPWEPRCIYPDFHHELVCGDIWSDNKLILASENGTFLVEDGLPDRLLFDKSVQIKQLNVVEQHGILLFRTGDKGKESNVYVYRLSELNGESNTTSIDYNSFEEDEDIAGSFSSNFTMTTNSNPSTSNRPTIIRTRSHIKERKLERTRDTDTVEGFRFIKEYNASEPPSVVTIIESTASDNEWLLCCGLRHHFELISVDGATKSLHMEASMKPHIVAALDLCEDEEPELLLCYNNTCHFQKLSEDTAASTEFDFNWNSVPITVACAFPYVIAFTTDTMEIRLIINGNLVHTISMPNLTLITSKHDTYFATTAPEFMASKCERIRVDTKTDKDDRTSNCSNRRCPSPIEPEILNAQPTNDLNFLTVEPHRLLSRSCSSSPTPNLAVSSASTPSK